MSAPLPCTSARVASVAHIASILALSVPEWERMLDLSARHRIVILETNYESPFVTRPLPQHYLDVSHDIVMSILRKLVLHYDLLINWTPPKGHVFRFFAGHFNREVPSSGVWSGWVTTDLLRMHQIFPGLPFPLAHDVVEVIGHLIFQAGFPAFVLVGEGFDTAVSDWLCDNKAKFWRRYNPKRSIAEQLDLQKITPVFFSKNLQQQFA